MPGAGGWTAAVFEAEAAAARSSGPREGLRPGPGTTVRVFERRRSHAAKILVILRAHASGGAAPYSAVPSLCPHRPP